MYNGTIYTTKSHFVYYSARQRLRSSFQLPPGVPFGEDAHGTFSWDRRDMKRRNETTKRHIQVERLARRATLILFVHFVTGHEDGNGLAQSSSGSVTSQLLASLQDRRRELLADRLCLVCRLTFLFIFQSDTNVFTCCFRAVLVTFPTQWSGRPLTK